jgi:hypothetical protein
MRAVEPASEEGLGSLMPLSSILMTFEALSAVAIISSTSIISAWLAASFKQLDEFPSDFMVKGADCAVSNFRQLDGGSPHLMIT